MVNVKVFCFHYTEQLFIVHILKESDAPKFGIYLEHYRDSAAIGSTYKDLIITTKSE